MAVTYQQCLEKIYQLGRFGIKLELETIYDILARLGHPEKKYPCVHVAGTNGKGSTATYMASILQAAGFKTGIYTSPHLVKFNERICINGQEISDADVVDAYEAVNAADIGERNATFFEIATAMAFYHFARENVDWAVIETGMGGRFDATNIIEPSVGVITNLSIEHTQYLGTTIQALAMEKGGIIKSGIPLVTSVHQPSGIRILKQIAREKNAPLYQYKHDFFVRKNPGKPTVIYRGLNLRISEIAPPLPGDHQKENLGMALAACELIFDKYKESDSRYQLTPDLVRLGLAGTRWPGRLEVIQQNPLVILDGAHNLKASQVLARYLSTTLAGRKLTLVIGILDDKPYEAMLRHLLPVACRVIITRAKIDRSLPTQVLAAAAKKIFKGPVQVIETVSEAVSHAISSSSEKDAVCIAGSLYVAGEAKEKFDLDFI
ncbi:MAG: folylpolyglutamate synthase/dihydrofolate synthase family protein [Desulfotignum sp.]|nr:folylpolyglutamate synthase/dihydrofolate synthase family protein [Desulfotignum sp.]